MNYSLEKLCYTCRKLKPRATFRTAQNGKELCEQCYDRIAAELEANRETMEKLTQ